MTEGGSEERRERGAEGGRMAGWQTHWHSAIQSVATPHLHVIARVAGQRSSASCIQASPNEAAQGGYSEQVALGTGRHSRLSLRS